MSYAQFTGLVDDLCQAIGRPDAQEVLERGAIEVEGFEVLIAHFDGDPNAMYLNYHFGILPAGRNERVMRLLLEANLTIYAQDQAQLGVHPDSGGILLIIRVPMGDDIDGAWLAETLSHYAEHGRYWRNNILESSDEMFEDICTGNYLWMRA